MTQAKKISTTLLFAGIASLVMILLTIGTWRAGPRAFLGDVAFVRYLIPVIFAIAAALVERHREGYLDFRRALKICFGIIVVAFAVQSIFAWVLIQYLDPAFGQALRPIELANEEAWYRRLHASEDDIRANIEAAKAVDPFSLGSTLFGLAKTYVLYFPVGVLLAAIIRRKQPARAPHKQL